MKRNRYHWIIITLCMMAGVVGCRKQDEAVVSVVTEKEHADAVDEDDSGNIEISTGIVADQGTTGNEPGAVVGRELVTVVTDAGETEKEYQRVRGNYGYSIAYDSDVLRFVPDDSADRIFEGAANSAETSRVLLMISENMEYALEELADEIVLKCNQECLVEEIFVGEEEYPATWIQYSEKTERGIRIVEYYLIGFENRVVEIELVCLEESMEQYYDTMQICLSTLVLDSIAEG